MILGVYNRKPWVAELALLNSLIKVEDVVQVTTPIKIKLWAYRWRQFKCRCLCVVTFLAGMWPLGLLFVMR